MDEAAQQLLHESRHAEVKLTSSMSFSASPSQSSRESTLSQDESADLAHPQSANFDAAGQAQNISIQHSLLTGKFSDLEVCHGSNKWNAHRLVVFSQSSILESMSETEKESISKLDLTVYDYPAVVRIMEYLYNGHYTSLDVEPEFFVPTHIRIFNLAIAFEISGLQSLAENKFRDALHNHITDVSVFLKCVAQIYSASTNQHPALRQIVVASAASEMSTLLNDEATKKGLLKLMTDVPDFHTDVLRLMVEHPEQPIVIMTQQLCEECGPTSEANKYTADFRCKGCGQEKSVDFY